MFWVGSPNIGYPLVVPFNQLKVEEKLTAANGGIPHGAAQDRDAETTVVIAGSVIAGCSHVIVDPHPGTSW